MHACADYQRSSRTSFGSTLTAASANIRSENAPGAKLDRQIGLPKMTMLLPHFAALWTRTLTAILVALVLVNGTSHVLASPQGIAGDSNGGDWVYVDHDLAGTRYSLIALDATTGHLAWYRQFVPHDVHDYDVSHVAPVFRTTINGSTRNVIASTGKDGLLRLLDRDSKDMIYSVPFTNRVLAEAPVTTTPVRVCPGTLGGEEWNGSAYD